MLNGWSAPCLPKTQMTFCQPRYCTRGQGGAVGGGAFRLYFAAHGFLHVGVVAALLYGSAWANPATVAVLTVFVAYQMVEWFAVGGVMLVLLSALDLAVIYLTLIERRRKRS